MRLSVEHGVATLWEGDTPVGEWQAGPAEYAAAGLDWPGCSCGEDECRHGAAHYWGERLSSGELNALH